MVSVVRDVVLLNPGRAKTARSEVTSRCRLLWNQLLPLMGEFSLGELVDTRNSFYSFCDAAAHRRIRQRQILVIAYTTMTVLAGVPTGWLVLRAFSSARPVALLAYLVTTVLLVGVAWWALHGRRAIATSLVVLAAVVAAYEFWPRSAAWWDLRALLALPATDGQRALAGVALGAGLTLALIAEALVSAIALTMVERSRQVGGSSDVRAFDYFLAVLELLLDTHVKPGGNRRRRIEEGLRTAEFALLVMARGGRPVSWTARWHGRRHHHEHMRRTRKIVEEIQRSNPLTGLRAADEKLLSATVTCLLGICQDQLGDVLTTFEELARRDTPPTTDQTPKNPSTRRRPYRAVQLGAAWCPLLILSVLRHFDVPATGPGWLWAVVVVIAVLGSFVILMPDLDPFLARLNGLLRKVSKALPAEEPAAEKADPTMDEAEGTVSG